MPFDLAPRIRAFFDRVAPEARGGTWLVGFSGGPDSTALLAALRPVAGERGVALLALHLDHRLDSGSSGRADSARSIAGRLGVDFRLAERDVGAARLPGESLEVAARRVRLSLFEETRIELGAGLVATGHTLDDQLETLVMRLGRGSGLLGLAGIAPRRGTLVRPLLATSRREVLFYLESLPILPSRDPTNRDLAIPRNRIRHHLLPRLESADPQLRPLLLSIARRSAALAPRIRRRLAEEWRLPASGSWPGLPVDRIRSAHPKVARAAIDELARDAGKPYPPPRSAVEALLEFLSRGKEGELPAGGGWRFELDRDRLRLLESGTEIACFAYTLTMPGSVQIAELGLQMRLRRAPVEPWMFHGAPDAAALSVTHARGDRATVRSRQPGDRFRPLGASGSRKLKEVLIDRRIARRDRDRLPILEIDGEIAWLPGIAIGESFRVAAGASEVWLAEIEALAALSRTGIAAPDTRLSTSEDGIS